MSATSLATVWGSGSWLALAKGYSNNEQALLFLHDDVEPPLHGDVCLLVFLLHFN